MKLLIDKCDRFLCDYLPKYPDSELLDIIFKYDISLNVDNIMRNLKKNLHLIFTESIEKYVFLKIKYKEMQELLKLREFMAKNEYYIIQAIIMWIQFNLDERVGDAELLFSNIDCKSCSKNLILENKNINTGNLILNGIIHKLYLKISINSDMTIHLLKFYKIDTFNSCIKMEDESVKVDTGSLFSLYKVDKDGIYTINGNKKILTCDFGNITRVIYIRNYLFCIDFRSGNMTKFDTSTNEVTNCAFPFNYTFSDNYYSPTINETSDGNLLAVGGLNKCKLYNIKKGNWTDFKALPHNVQRHATVIDGQDIYVIGGEGTNKLLRYRDGEWLEMQPLSNAHNLNCAFVYDKHIYVYGRDTIPKVYDISADQWTTIDTNVFNSINSYDSIYSEYERLFYMKFREKIYSISLETDCKTLLYENVNVNEYCMVLLDI